MRPPVLPLLAALPLLAGCARGDLTPPELYADHCARCHGPRGEGKPRALKLYPHVDLHASPMSREGNREAIRMRIEEGAGPMPAFKRRLTPAEIAKLVDYTIRLSRSPKEDP